MGIASTHVPSLAHVVRGRSGSYFVGLLYKIMYVEAVPNNNIQVFPRGDMSGMHHV